MINIKVLSEIAKNEKLSYLLRDLTIPLGVGFAWFVNDVKKLNEKETQNEK